jgi:hypothetical protein
MKNEFIPYEQALKLKELGFDEPCLAYYNINDELTFTIIVSQNTNSFWLANPSNIISAPLYQQAFRWFREKGYRFTLSSDYENGIYYFDVWKSNQFMFETDYIYNTYEEAELACLKKLIEIVNTKEK